MKIIIDTISFEINPYIMLVALMATVVNYGIRKGSEYYRFINLPK